MTEISTPIRAPDFAVLRLSIPAAPAQAAMKNAKKSGEEMMLEKLWFSAENVVVEEADRLERQGHGVDGEDASGKPTASAVNERIASAPRRCTSATQKPASGPNSGPTTIAPTISTAESW